MPQVILFICLLFILLNPKEQCYAHHKLEMEQTRHKISSIILNKGPLLYSVPARRIQKVNQKLCIESIELLRLFEKYVLKEMNAEPLFENLCLFQVDWEGKLLHIYWEPFGQSVSCLQEMRMEECEFENNEMRDPTWRRMEINARV